jgi:RNA polymerase sigma-70 factor (ECF subfamily)
MSTNSKRPGLSQYYEQIGLLEEHIPHLRRYARFLTKDFEQADDMVQDCLVRAIENIEKWEPDTNMRAWLIVILRNNFFNHCRRARKETEIKFESGLTASTINPAAQEDSIALDELTLAFGELTPSHREVIHLISVDGMKYEDAADILGISVGTVKSRLSRARNELRKILDGEADAKVVSIVDVRAQRETGRGEREARSAAATKRLSEQFSALLRAPSAAPLH